MLTTNTLNALTSLVDSAIEQVKQLCLILEKEQQALLSEDHAALEQLIEQKLLTSQSLDLIEMQRQNIMSSAGLNTDNDSMPSFLLANQTNTNFRPLIKSWESLMALLKESANQNQLNGILLEKQRQHVQRALKILLEQSSSPDIYDAGGATSQPKYTRSVGVV